MDAERGACRRSAHAPCRSRPVRCLGHLLESGHRFRRAALDLPRQHPCHQPSRHPGGKKNVHPPVRSAADTDATGGCNGRQPCARPAVEGMAHAGRPERRGCPVDARTGRRALTCVDHPPRFGILTGKRWWRLGSNQRHGAYASLLAGSLPFATIRFCPSGRRKSGDVNSRE